MNDLWGDMTRTLELLDIAIPELKKRGRAMVKAEADYYTMKAHRTFEMKEDGLSAAMISLVIKGECREELEAYHAAQVEYDNAREAVMVYKKRVDVLREQIEREWSRAGDKR